MADISVLARLLNGAMRNVDLTANTPVVLSIKVGGVTNTELTKVILDRLVSLQNGSDVDASYHTHDGRYFTESELGSATSSSGSDLIGDDNTYSNFTPAAATVKGALSGIDTAIGAASGTKVKISAADTLSEYLDPSISAGAGLSKAILNPGANESLDLSVNVDGSTLEINSDALRVKDAGITNAKVASGIDAVKIADGSVSNTEFQYLDGVTSAIQTQINSKQSLSEKGAANGYASLDSGGKVPVAQLPNSVMEFQGVWNATTNSPALVDGTGNIGDVYRVNVAGSQNLGSGSQTFIVGDWVIYDSGGIWRLAHAGADAVVSVNGAAGVVTVNAINQLTGDVTAGPASGSASAVATIANNAITTVKILDANVTLAKLASNSVDENKIASSSFNAAGAVTGGGGSKIAVQVDGSTIEINSNALRVKDAGITLAKLASLSVDENKLTASIAGAGLTGGAGSPLAVGANADGSIVVAADDIKVASSPLMRRVMVAGEAFAANTSFLVRWALTGETAGRVYKADKDASSLNKYHAVGMALSTGAVSAGGNITVITEGEHVLGSSDSAFAGADVGKELFVGSSGAFILGASLANTANEAAFCVGVVQDTGKVWIGEKQLRGIA